MIVVMFGKVGETLTSVAVRRDEIAIGSDSRAEIVVPPAEAVHARLVADPQGWVLVTAAPVVINGHEVEGRFVIGVEDEIRIANYTLAIRPVQVDAREQELITAAAKDDDARLIYADWLEERGQWDRAEFLRLQHEAKGLDAMSPTFQALAERIRKRATAVDLAWRMMVSRDDVQNCRSVTRELTCTMDWSGLEPTVDPKVRSCRGCRKDVHYCETEHEAALHARIGDCIVLDIGMHRAGLLEDALQRARRDRPGPTTADYNGPVTPPGMYLPAVAYQPSTSPPAVAIVTCKNCNASMSTMMQFCPVCSARR